MKYAPAIVARVPGILTARAILSLVFRPPPASSVLALVPSLALGVAVLAEVVANSGGSIEAVVKGFDEEDTGNELLVDRYTVDRLAGAGAEKVSSVGLLQSDFPSFIPQHLQI